VDFDTAARVARYLKSMEESVEGTSLAEWMEVAEKVVAGAGWY